MAAAMEEEREANEAARQGQQVKMSAASSLTHHPSPASWTPPALYTHTLSPLSCLLLNLACSLLQLSRAALVPLSAALLFLLALCDTLQIGVSAVAYFHSCTCNPAFVVVS